MAFLKPSKPSGTLPNFSQRDLLCSSLSHGNLSEHLTLMLLSTQNDNTCHERCLSCWMERVPLSPQHNESCWKPTTLHQNPMSYGQQAWVKANAVKSCVTWTRSADSEFLWICGSACLMNVCRVHVGPVNGSSDVMKQPLRRRKWSVCLNRNVTTQ